MDCRWFSVDEKIKQWRCLYCDKDIDIIMSKKLEIPGHLIKKCPHCEKFFVYIVTESFCEIRKIPCLNGLVDHALLPTHDYSGLYCIHCFERFEPTAEQSAKLLDKKKEIKLSFEQFIEDIDEWSRND
jgi:phage FluMu protein Com